MARPAPTGSVHACIFPYWHWSVFISGHGQAPLVSLACGPIRPFPPSQGWDTIPIARRPAVQFNPFYLAGQLPSSSALLARSPPDKSVQASPSLAAPHCVAEHILRSEWPRSAGTIAGMCQGSCGTWKALLLGLGHSRPERTRFAPHRRRWGFRPARGPGPRQTAGTARPPRCRAAGPGEYRGP